MRKLAIITAVSAGLAAAPRPAEACTCGPDCLPWLEPVAYVLGAGMVGAYAYGTGYYIAGDLDGEPKSTNYYGSELILHGALGTVLGGAAIDAARHGHVTTTLITGGLAATHLALASNGLRGLVRQRDEFHPNDTVVTWGVGAVTGINALVWASGMSESHGRSYGLAEVAINAPFVAGFAHLAKDRLDAGRTGPALAYAGIAAVSTLYVAHGVKTIVRPHRAPKLDLLGTELTPTVVSDGRELAPGLATAGTF